MSNCQSCQKTAYVSNAFLGVERGGNAQERGWSVFSPEVGCARRGLRGEGWRGACKPGVCVWGPRAPRGGPFFRSDRRASAGPGAAWFGRGGVWQRSTAGRRALLALPGPAFFFFSPNTAPTADRAGQGRQLCVAQGLLQVLRVQLEPDAEELHAQGGGHFLRPARAQGGSHPGVQHCNKRVSGSLHGESLTFFFFFSQVADSVLTAHSTKSQAGNTAGKIAKVHRDEAGHGEGEAGGEAPAEEAPADE